MASRTATQKANDGFQARSILAGSVGTTLQAAGDRLPNYPPN
jgi:hypothetical protein